MKSEGRRIIGILLCSVLVTGAALMRAGQQTALDDKVRHR